MSVRIQEITTKISNQNMPDALPRILSYPLEESEDDIVKNYSHNFITIIGAGKILSLPVVSAESLQLVKGKSPRTTVTPSMLPPGVSAVRVPLGENQPGLAINVEMLSKVNKVVDVVTEIIFKQYSVHEKLGEGKFVTAASNIGTSGEEYLSLLCRAEKMSDQQIEAVRDLLDGKIIKPPCRVGQVEYIRMQQKV